VIHVTSDPRIEHAYVQNGHGKNRNRRALFALFLMTNRRF